jgi:hypothetical protein
MAIGQTSSTPSPKLLDQQAVGGTKGRPRGVERVMMGPKYVSMWTVQQQAVQEQSVFKTTGTTTTTSTTALRADEYTTTTTATPFSTRQSSSEQAEMSTAANGQTLLTGPRNSDNNRW